VSEIIIGEEYQYSKQYFYEPFESRFGISSTYQYYWAPGACTCSLGRDAWALIESLGLFIYFRLRILAQVVLDKLSNVKTVVNKLHEIDSVYRNFELEILAGEPNTIVKCRESKATFQFDFAKVYWNPRLSIFI